jgi:hypothetical protein
MIELPKLALSVRQPWAHAIVHLGKHLENRSWGSWNHHLKKQRGPICIHASSGMTRDEYENARDYMQRNGVTCPEPAGLVRGGIIGTAVVVDWVRTSHSFWFMGPGALSLRDMTPVEPVPCSGALGFFEWKPAGELTPPAKWMWPAQPKPEAASSPQARLL